MTLTIIVILMCVISFLLGLYGGSLFCSIRDLDRLKDEREPFEPPWIELLQEGEKKCD